MLYLFYFTDYLNKMIIKFIMSATIPFSIVENEDFIELINCGFPNKNVLCRPTLMKKIGEMSKQLVENFKKEMASVEYITTTVDCWSIFKKYIYNIILSYMQYSIISITKFSYRSYIGITGN